MRITLGVRHFRNVGGAEKFTMNLARFLAGRGHEVKVLAIDAEPMDGVAVETVPAPRRMPRSLRDWLTGRRLAEALARERADVTFSEQKVWNGHVIRPGGGVEAEYWEHHLEYRFQRLELPSCLAWLEPKRWFDLDAERRCFASPRLHSVIANSAMVRDQMLRHYPGLKDRIRVVYNGVAAARAAAAPRTEWREVIRRELRLGDDAVVALFMGHDFRRKGLAQAIEAVAEAVRRDPAFPLRLVVAGRGSTASYARLARSSGLGERVLFAGAVAAPEKYLAAADVLLLPSFYDPFANVTTEALAAGLPVITTRLNGGHEIIRHGENGWIVDSPRAAGVMAGFLLELRDPLRRDALRAGAAAAGAEHRLEDKLLQVEQILVEAATANRACASVSGSGG